MYKSSNILMCLSIFAVCQSARILIVVPTPSISHQVPFRPLTLELVKRGHEVTVITTDPIYPKGQAPENLTEIDLHDASYEFARTFFKESETSGKSSDIKKQMIMSQPLPKRLLEIHLKSEEILQTIKNKKFDLLILEAVMRPFILYSHIFKGVPLIMGSSFGAFNPTFDYMGAPTRPALLYPTILRQKIYDLTLWEKVNELYNHYVLAQIFEEQVPEDDKALKKLWGEDTPTISELENNVDLVLLNVHPIWDHNRPVPPSVVYVGGIHQKPQNDLPKDLQSYLDASVHGVIYISFGSNVVPSLLPPERIQILINVFSKLPYDVLWKWDKDQLPGVSSNVKISKWLPQSDLLRHPKLKLFITQGGLQSTDEAILAGVPLIGMPIVGDQWFNVEQYVHHKIGIRLDFEYLNEEKLLNVINTITSDNSFRANVVRLRSIMYDQPQSALSRAVWWTEHVLRHGGRHLRAPAANLSWGEYLDVQLMTALAAAVITLTSIAASVIYIIYRLLRNYLSVKEKKE